MSFLESFPWAVLFSFGGAACAFIPKYLQLRESLAKEQRESAEREKELHSQIDKLRKDNSKATDFVSAATKSREKECKELQKKLVALDSQVVEQKAKVQELLQALRQMQVDKGQMSTLLEQRGKELKDVALWLNKTDAGVSGDDIAQAITKLNQEVFQLSAEMVESCSFVAQRVDSRQLLESVSSSLVPILGSRMIHLLTTAKHSVDPIIVQFAVQGLLCMHISHIVSDWCFLNSIVNNFMNDICHRMAGSEEQTILGRWRSLAFRSIPPLDQKLVIDGALRYIAGILSLAGNSKPHDATLSLLSQKYAGKIGNVLQNTNMVREIVKVKVISCDYHILFFPPDRPFDPHTMEDDTGSYQPGKGSSPAESVLCTNALGLWYTEKNAKAKERHVVLKCSVILVSGLDSELLS